MTEILSRIEYLFVCVFGTVLSVAYCDVPRSRKNKIIIGIAPFVLLTAIFFCYPIFSQDFWKKVCPLVLHVPLVIFLVCLTRNLSCSVISVATAYLCCQFRNWIGLFVATLFGESNTVFIWTKLIITFPLLAFLLIFFAPIMKSYQKRPLASQWIIGGVPIFYYLYDYFFVIYTDLLYRRTPVVLEFMPFVCCLIYVVFLFLLSDEEKKRIELEKLQNSLNMAVSHSVSEIEAMRKSQDLASQYRHDLRHHLQYIASCLENDELDMAKGYIKNISSEIEAQKVRVFCENESANLILSTFAAACEKDGTQFNVDARLTQSLPISDSDLCVILSNAIENAINACNELPPYIEKIIEVKAYEKNGRLFLKISNTCKDNIAFNGRLPITSKAGHGFGTKSILGIVERHGGLYNFSVKDNRFTLQISL
ncbi:MAG: GHKL domain-containing protein [Treponemataceae bacterium]|nr:GHKL domain-containing protein [Treponemataceae bacterium]